MDVSTGSDVSDKVNGTINNGWDFHFSDHIILRILMARNFKLTETCINLR